MQTNKIITDISEEANTVERIRLNALEHFSKHGYVGASVREITQAARVTKPTLYYYFRNKEDLYRGLAEECMNKFLQAMKSTTSTSDLLIDRFCGLVESFYTFCEEDFLSARFIHVISFSPKRDVPDVGIDGFRKNVSDIIEGIVTDSVLKGEIPEDKKNSVLLILHGLFSKATEQKLADSPVPVIAFKESLSYLLQRNQN